MSEQLVAGNPLSEVAALNPYVMPQYSELAARLGESAGELGNALRAAKAQRRPSAPYDFVFPVRWGSLIYFAALAGIIVPFTAYRLMVPMQRVYHDFHRSLPPLTGAYLTSSRHNSLLSHVWPAVS